MSTAIVTAGADKYGLIKNEIGKASGMMTRVAPKNFQNQMERLVTCFNVARRKTPALLDCDPRSVVLALAMASSIGILPNTPANHAYLIPYKQECQLQISYPGLIYLAERTGIVTVARGVAVYAADFFELEEGTSPRIIHKPAIRNRGGDTDIIGAYGAIKMANGDVQFRWLDRDALDKRKAKSQGGGTKGPWVDWFKEMCEKSGIKYVMKQVPIGNEAGERLMKAMDHDDRTEIGLPADTSDLEGFDDEQPSTPVKGSLAEKAGA